ncbi:MAG: hypothetical protein ACOCVC_05310 [Spirochaeta sp.]
MKNRFLVCIIAGVLACTSLLSVSAQEETQWHKGFLINTGPLPLEIHDYQGGLGIKLGQDMWSVRALTLLSIRKNQEGPTYSQWGLGAVFEWHLSEETVSPYLGGAARFLSRVEKTVEQSGDDWVRDTIRMVEIGPLVGLELRLHETISLFAEYQLRLQGNWPSTTTSVAGETSIVKDDMWWDLNLGLGNNGMIGICIYF